MISKIKKWFANSTLDCKRTSDDVDVEVARANYQIYQDRLKQQQDEYTKALCKKIKLAAIQGKQSIETATLLNDFMTKEFMVELKRYFEQRGFAVSEERNSSGVLTSWLKISWQ